MLFQTSVIFAIGGRPKKARQVERKTTKPPPLRQLRQLAECLKNAGKKQVICQKGPAIGGEGRFSRQIDDSSSPSLP
jgi:hypothetical protein